MSILSDREWKTKYTPDDGDLVKLFYVPVLEVLPVSKTFTGIDEPSEMIADSASDFEALEMLRRLAFQEQVDKPTQLDFWKEEAA